MPRFISIFLCLALLTGCSSHKIQTQTVIYHGDMHKNRGAIIIRPVDSAWDDSLEFNAVKSAIAVRLKKHSYILTADEASASYKALVSYGIDEGRAKTVYQPIKQPYANTAVTLQKNAGNTSLATTEVIPHYYVSGHQPVNIIEYKKHLFIDIYDMSTQKKVYEIRTYCLGTENLLQEVILKLVEAAFISFPAENGKCYTRDVYID